MMRRTKIVATLGPATDELDVLVEMCHAGLDVARINFSHGTQQDHLRRLELLREAMRRTGELIESAVSAHAAQLRALNP